MNTNRNLLQAQKAKNNEYYTLYEDIEKECNHYRYWFKDKIIYCNCDSTESNFYKYFKDNFKEFGLKELWITSLNGEYIRYNGNYSITEIDGDMFSEDCLDLLKRCDIVVTNSPFSEFRRFFDVLMEYDKDFIIVGNNNCISYNNIFPKIIDNTIRTGYSNLNTFNTPNGIKRVAALWLTTFPVINNKWLELKETFSIEKYPLYDDYLAFNVDRTKDIPKDKTILFNGKYITPILGVPISFIDKYNPEQFEIVGKLNAPQINGQNKFKRLLITQKDKTILFNGNIIKSIWEYL